MTFCWVMIRGGLGVGGRILGDLVVPGCAGCKFLGWMWCEEALY